MPQIEQYPSWLCSDQGSIIFFTVVEIPGESDGDCNGFDGLPGNAQWPEHPPCPTEFRLLEFRMQHPNRTFSREEIIYEIWGADAIVEARTVDVHVQRLRDSITREGEPDVIRTVRTAGTVLTWNDPARG